MALSAPNVNIIKIHQLIIVYILSNLPFSLLKISHVMKYKNKILGRNHLTLKNYVLVISEQCTSLNRLEQGVNLQ